MIYPDYVSTNGRSLEANVSGRWDWSTRGVACADSAHSIAFSDDGKVMTITQEYQVVDSSGRDWTVTTYDILAKTTSRIRSVMRGEPRLTDQGIPVMWELVVTDSNTHLWHRSDWPPWGYTVPFHRCPKPTP
jgi:hypothetical protein